jgi:hypothetical protein
LLSLERGVVDGKGVLAAQQLPYPLATVLSLSTTLSFLSSRAYPDFLLRSSHRCHLCGSPQREPHTVVRSRNLDRKSGEAEGSAVRHSGAPNLPFYNHFPLVILRACDFFDLFVFSASNQPISSPRDKAVILRVCNFIGFEKKLMLKTKGLGASKVGKNQ